MPHFKALTTVSQTGNSANRPNLSQFGTLSKHYCHFVTIVKSSQYAAMCFLLYRCARVPCFAGVPDPRGSKYYLGTSQSETGSALTRRQLLRDWSTEKETGGVPFLAPPLSSFEELLLSAPASLSHHWPPQLPPSPEAFPERSWRARWLLRMPRCSGCSDRQSPFSCAGPFRFFRGCPYAL